MTTNTIHLSREIQQAQETRESNIKLGYKIFQIFNKIIFGIGLTLSLMHYCSSNNSLWSSKYSLVSGVGIIISSIFLKIYGKANYETNLELNKLNATMTQLYQTVANKMY